MSCWWLRCSMVGQRFRVGGKVVGDVVSGAAWFKWLGSGYGGGGGYDGGFVEVEKEKIFF